MNPATPLSVDARTGRWPDEPGADAASSSGVSWGAILAGAAGAAALSLILLILGTGLGLSTVSPWSGQGASATAFGVSTIVWVTFTQLAASGIGGYLAGRLRTRWAAVHADEVYFRDTAHGFLAWSVATLVTAATLTSAIGAIVGSGVQAGAAVAGGAATTAAAGVSGVAAAAGGRRDTSDPDASGYFIDSLFRSNSDSSAAMPVAAAAPADPAASGAAVAPPSDASTSPSSPPALARAPHGPMGPAQSAEVGRIFANALRTGSLAADDSRYVAQRVAQQTGLAPADAEKRVSEVFGRMQARLKEAETTARDAADQARKASSYAALWLFVSLLIGAFVASLSATYGGRQRDL